MRSEKRWHDGKRVFVLVPAAMLLLLTIACRTEPPASSAAGPALNAAATAASARETAAATAEPPRAETARPTEEPDPPEAKEAQEKMLEMRIDGTAVAVEWENNESVAALRALCAEKPLVIPMSMYGGFEQVGPLGARLPAHDTQTRTSPGDVVLYSSDQIVVFYGSNSWAYTRLGHIVDQYGAGMTALLGHGDVTVTLSLVDGE